MSQHILLRRGLIHLFLVKTKLRYKLLLEVADRTEYPFCPDS